MKLKLPLVLCSQSPRRSHLLKKANIPFSTYPLEVEESYPEQLPYQTIPLYLASKKWQAAQPHFTSPVLILTADTLVFLDQKPLGKPKDRDEATFFLKLLSNRTHEVITAFCLGPSSQTHPLIGRWVKTDVTFRPLTDQEIEHYVASGSPFDKAGGYGYQDDQGKNFIKAINGLESNVIGLPIEIVLEDLRSFAED